MASVVACVGGFVGGASVGGGVGEGREVHDDEAVKEISTSVV